MNKIWFKQSVAPKRKGVYETTHRLAKDIGGAYGYWDGRRWKKYGNWADYSYCGTMLWRGAGKNQSSPLPGIKP